MPAQHRHGSYDLLFTKQQLYLLKTRYGFSPIDCYRIVARQRFRCAVCLKAPPSTIQKKNFFNADHDHRTLTFRGFLCFSCNSHLVGGYEKLPWMLQDSATLNNYLRYPVKQRLILMLCALGRRIIPSVFRHWIESAHDDVQWQDDETVEGEGQDDETVEGEGQDDETPTYAEIIWRRVNLASICFFAGYLGSQQICYQSNVPATAHVVPMARFSHLCSGLGYVVKPQEMHEAFQAVGAIVTQRGASPLKR